MPTGFSHTAFLQAHQMLVSLSVLMAADRDGTVKLKSQIPPLPTTAHVNHVPQQHKSHNTSPRADTCSVTAQQGKYPAHPVLMNPVAFMRAGMGEGAERQRREE